MSNKKLTAKKYKTHLFDGAFKASFGMPEKKARWLVFGGSGEGKTDFCMKLCKYLSQFGKSLYYSREEGDSSSLQECGIRNNISEVPKRKMQIIFDGTFADLHQYLTDNPKAQNIIIDSVDYLELTVAQYKKLVQDFPDKTFVFVAWKEGRKPKNAAARAMEFMVDVKIEVKHYVAFPRSRYGGNQPFIIWEEGAKKHHAFLNI